MIIEHYIWTAALAPVIAGLVSFLMPSPRRVLAVSALGVLIVAGLDAWIIASVLAHGPAASSGDWFRVDALSAYHMAVMMLVFLSSSLYSVSYFRSEPGALQLSLKSARRFALLWHGALAAMTSDYRGNPVEIPERDRKAVMEKIMARRDELEKGRR